MAKHINYSEALDVLRAILSGDMAIRLADSTVPWKGCNGICWFVAGNYQISFFCDAGELDYVDWIEASDGRIGEDGIWSCRDPIDELTDEEWTQLDQILHRAR